MFQELKFQLSTAILTILTLAAGVAAVINYQQTQRFRLHEDGIIWVDRAAGVTALEAPRDSQGYRAFIRRGDVLKAINNVAVKKAIDVAKILAPTQPYISKLTYTVVRRGIQVELPNVLVGEAQPDRSLIYAYMVGFAYLVIGLFVYFRRGSAQKALHFYVLCLASFIYFTFHFTGHLDLFDQIIYYGNVAAGLLAPALFLHFCVTFPEPLRSFRTPVRIGLLYIPSVLVFLVYVGFASGSLKSGVSLRELSWFLDRVWMALATLPYLVGAVALSVEYKRADDTVVRQQLKWLRNGTICGMAPFAFLYVIPYAMGALPGEYLKLSVVSVVLIPLTLAYAIVRYRLMDVDILFRRGYAYTLATLCVLAAFYGVVFSLGSLVHKHFSELGDTSLISVMLIASFLFQPIRNWIQERLDKYFYRESYDYRRTLIEFARELSAETDLDTMLASAGDRLL
jgi:two-component system NtrC family sensor kinase